MNKVSFKFQSIVTQVMFYNQFISNLIVIKLKIELQNILYSDELALWLS